MALVLGSTIWRYINVAKPTDQAAATYCSYPQTSSSIKKSKKKEQVYAKANGDRAYYFILLVFTLFELVFVNFHVLHLDVVPTPSY